MSEQDERPDFTTMRGMIWNANHALDHALHPHQSGIPAEIVKKCKGVLLMYVQELGFVVTKSSGTGVIMAKNEKGEWSPPSAISVSNTGFGLVFGGTANDVLVFFMSDEALEKVLSLAHTHKSGVYTGVEVSATVGPWGRTMQKVAEGESLVKQDTLMYSFSKGVFTGIEMKKPVLMEQRQENHHFYGIKASATEILFEKNKVTVPPNSGVEEMHHRLSLLQGGETKVLSDEEKEAKEKLRVSLSFGGSNKDEEKTDDA